MTFIFNQWIIVAALKNMNSALYLDFINSHIYFRTLDVIKNLLSTPFMFTPGDIPVYFQKLKVFQILQETKISRYSFKNTF